MSTESRPPILTLLVIASTCFGGYLTILVVGRAMRRRRHRAWSALLKLNVA